LLVRSCDQLGHFLQHRETNLRYLALESLCRLAGSEFCLDVIKKHRGTVIKALKVMEQFLLVFYLKPPFSGKTTFFRLFLDESSDFENVFGSFMKYSLIRFSDT